MEPLSGGLARTSRVAAVRAAAVTGQLEVDQLAAVLYRAGGATVGRHRDSRWATQLTDVARRSAGPGFDLYALTRTEAWTSWNLPGVDPAGLEHKLYVSPTVAALPRALPIVFARNVELHVPAWKVGAGAPGLYRPDKIVCYFATPTAAVRAGRQLALALRGVPAQGVPFSGALDKSGIVSWGRDLDGRSWRLMVCAALARELVAARQRLGIAATAERVAAAALDALGNAGLDVVHWHPSVPEPVAA
ncbi:MAG TPA: hypothetical protein VLJ88_12415 [Propionibacteriaceae bacterium]|nr:hypothetical protein [Propionibacteriaceae bacterium]